MKNKQWCRTCGKPIINPFEPNFRMHWMEDFQGHDVELMNSFNQKRLNSLMGDNRLMGTKPKNDFSNWYLVVPKMDIIEYISIYFNSIKKRIA